MRRFHLLFIALLILYAGCAGPPVRHPGPQTTPVEDKRGDSPREMENEPGKKNNVVERILRKVEKLLSAGRPEKAVIELENAARISPKRADIYLRLGEIRYEQKLCHQAAGMARKARHLGLNTAENLSSAKKIISGCSNR